MNVGRLALENIEQYGVYPMFEFEGRTITNMESDLYARSMAAVLREFKVVAGDRVLVMMPNTPEIVASFQATWKIGGVILPVTPMLNAREIAYMLENSGAKVALVMPVLAGRVAEAIKLRGSAAKLLVLGETAVEGAINIKPLLGSTTAIQNMAEREPDDMAMLLYTSGTTGHPKGVMLTHQNLWSNAHSVAAMRGDDYPPQTMSMHVLPLSHSFGVMMMCAGYLAGSRSVMLTHFDPIKAFQAIQEFKVEAFSAVPTMLTYMLNHPDKGKYDLSSLRKIVSGGAALPNEVRLEFERVFGCEAREGYGLSETSPVAAGYGEGVAYRPGSVGRAIEGVTITIMNDRNEEQPRGEHGEICIKGPNVMKGYWGNEEASREALAAGWFHSGDIGHMDEDGFVYITDRKKDIIIKGGENISPREIEEALHEHPAVAECAVVGVPDPVFNENLCAVVVLRQGHKATEEEIRAHIAARVTKFKVPAHIKFTSFMPKNPVGKILKRDLRKLMADAVAKDLAANAKAPSGTA